jgi:patatin-like phospholipase/acyl hydrolase
MKKIKRYTTTEFYNNPSKALNFVRDGGTVYLGYKRVKEPLAVITSYKEYTEKKETMDKSKSFFERYKDQIVEAPEYKDSVKFIREQREQG